MVKLTGSLSHAGAQVRYADSQGDGQPLVFIHGAGLNHAMFEAQADALQEAGFRTLVWDLRGHGESVLESGVRFTAADALDDLAALTDHLGIDSPVLVGHSIGGNLAQAFVRAHPGRARGLIVLDSTWNARPLSSFERLGLRLAAPVLQLVPASRLPGLMARASAVQPDAIEETEAMFAHMPKPTFLDVWRGAVSLIAPDETYRTPVPLALIRGARDRTGNIATAMPDWARAEGVRERVIPDAGHVVTLDAPGATSQAILQALDQWRLDGSLETGIDR